MRNKIVQSEKINANSNGNKLLCKISISKMLKLFRQIKINIVNYQIDNGNSIYR